MSKLMLFVQKGQEIQSNPKEIIFCIIYVVLCLTLHAEISYNNTYSIHKTADLGLLGNLNSGFPDFHASEDIATELCIKNLVYLHLLC